MTLTATNITEIDTQTSVSPAAFRDGMASLAGAVSIVTTIGKAGKAGFTATAVCSVSDDPATLLVCLNRSASVHQIFMHSTHLAINTLADKQDNLSNLFGGKAAMGERFEQGDWGTLQTGCPVLNTAAVTFDCEIIECKSVATHDVIFCRVLDIKQNLDAGALLYYQRGYYHVTNNTQAK
ncbi:flavin reductase [Pseudocolwellia sp. AS88]|uniref:flavin reductase n=1 Tax=Pseudocolwellia sp. AS88 TaxID=3063958 RepID=UPI0026F0ABCE|nr:flavin reductase [Pseudocolwellia sp. AS88]MDO7085253.1 flavin reductase [Pseudocolwellia sp. AS88]